MEKRFFTWALAAALCVGGALTSCSDDDTTPSMSFPCTGKTSATRIPKHASPNSSPTTSR